jgi:hypothetical protein
MGQARAFFASRAFEAKRRVLMRLPRSLHSPERMQSR